MQDQILSFFREHPQLAFWGSLLISVVIAVLGVVPSFFVTAANIVFFGFWKGTLVSIAGEALGAIIAFYLYRKGFRKTTSKSLEKFPKVQSLVDAEGQKAFMLIFSLRLIPFVPSGLVTLAAAIGKVSPWVFLIASTLGKIPALLLEAWSVNEVTQFSWQGKLVLLLVGLYLVYLVVKKK